jgi:hydroxyacylglutathione hydrolase
MDVLALADQLASAPPDQAPVVLDVRTTDEWAAGHIDGAHHLFAGEIVNGARPAISPDRQVAVICATGYRSGLAASLLEQRDFCRLAAVTEGMDGWTAAGLPVVRS